MSKSDIIAELWLEQDTAIIDTRQAIKKVATLGLQFETDYGNLVLTQRERAKAQAYLLGLLQRRLSILEERNGPPSWLMDHDDNLTLCREHMEHAEALFYSITKLLNSPETVLMAKRLARIGSQLAASSLVDINGQLAALNAQEMEANAARAAK
ncbi:hypothetical protein [Vreelandella titanicae]|uniref:hypothetical protein n=1 Tax=Vreelandella titanicae TaxID=664683 RepID=UPI003FD7876C|tara:strand:+ start:291 stop:752 length:462 start_codon:yes stop_codon:yes gene_type:complete